MIDHLPDLVLFASIAILVWIIKVDVATLKITNRSVLILFAVYLVWAALTGFGTIWSDVASGAILFSLALVMWLLGTMGAGDVKLYAVIGCLVGIDQLLIFSLLLLFVSIAFLAVIQIVGRMSNSGRLHEIRLSGKAPYAVPMCLAAIPSILLRAFG